MTVNFIVDDRGGFPTLIVASHVLGQQTASLGQSTKLLHSFQIFFELDDKTTPSRSVTVNALGAARRD